MDFRIPFTVGITALVLPILYISSESLKQKVYTKLDQFNLENLSIGDNIFIIGRRNSGKSTLVSKIIQKNQDYNIAEVFSPTETLDKHYKKLGYGGNVHQYYNTDIIGNFIKNQKDNINSHILEDNESFIVLDNCLLRQEYNDTNLSDLLVNGYFYHTINIITAASPWGFSRSFNTNCDYLFVYRDQNILYKKSLYNVYFKDLVSYRKFDKLYDEYTKDYGCLVVDYKNGNKIYCFK